MELQEVQNRMLDADEDESTQLKKEAAAIALEIQAMNKSRVGDNLK